MRNIFRIQDLRRKIMFTLFIIAAYRLGSQVPVPGIDFDAIVSLREQASSTGGVLALLNLFSGGALTNFAIFALGIMPYITASIIIQILTVAIPRFEQLQQQGAVGQRKLDPVHPLPDAWHRIRAGHWHHLHLRPGTRHRVGQHRRSDRHSRFHVQPVWRW